MKFTRQDIEACHAAYCRTTGFELPLSMDRESAWCEWLHRGLTAADVELWISHIKQRNLSAEPRFQRSLVFRNIILRPDWAEEDLSEIRARQRVPAPKPNRESVLRATGREERPEPPPARPAAAAVNDFLESLRKAAGHHDQQ